MHLGMTGEGIAPQSPMPSPESRRKRLSTSPEGRGKRSAFSLVELSIVLVILGLLVGGVLTGQALIRAAQLRSATTEYQKYSTAVQSFRDKYFAIPGDMLNATAFWGPSTSCPGTAGTGTQTCDGNGNGQLITTCPATSQYCENFTFWQHLANAGLIEGTYTGMTTAVSTTQINSTNSPTSKLSSGLWMVGNDISGGTAFFPEAVARHNFRLGAMTATSWPAGKLFTPAEMWGIDTKLDDGTPGNGKLTTTMSSYATLPNCATTSVASTAAYNLSLSSLECIGAFATGF